ncbi:hypothetical protein K435DRAFT_963397 [Dendrothele bispora CBS 962.96]|uniref:Uncharacterized protein n=1 Tax=Dendrothele bispora (strain CBS 962.96) TaxID=1314807 RepID=A0A4S8MGT2_DENBC|nr:hypothetical protein K435DRAFT_963397 [Dendrothele bispora CBS 962.96]
MNRVGEARDQTWREDEDLVEALGLTSLEGPASSSPGGVRTLRLRASYDSFLRRDTFGTKMTKTEKDSLKASSPSFRFESLPEELWSAIVENSFMKHESNQITVSMHDNTCRCIQDLRDSNPLYHLSMVNKRFRRVFLPWLFRTVRFFIDCSSYGISHSSCIYGDSGAVHPDEVGKLRDALDRNKHLAGFIRTVTFVGGNMRQSRQLFLPFVFDLLHSCPQLKRMILQYDFKFGGWADQVELVEAVNSHPSADFRVVYPNLNSYPGHRLDLHLPPPTVSLSRVILLSPSLSDFRNEAAAPYLQVLMERGVQVESITFPPSIFADLGSWRQLTYPGLRHVGGWKISESCRWPELEQFISRHPFLDSVLIAVITGESLPWLTEVPWARFSAKIPPGCLLNSMVAFRRDSDYWKLIHIRITLLHESEDEGSYEQARVYSRRTTSPRPQICNLFEETKATLKDLGGALPTHLRSLTLRCEHPVSRPRFRAVISEENQAEFVSLLNRPSLRISIPSCNDFASRGY